MCLNWYDSQVSVTSCGDQAPESFVGDDQADQEPAATTTSEPSSKRAKPTVVRPRTLKRPATQLTFMESFRAKANQKFSITNKNGTTISGLSKEQVQMSGGIRGSARTVHACPVCSRVFEKPQALSNHLKSHKDYVASRNAGVIMTTNAAVNAAAQAAAVRTFCTIQANSIIAACLDRMQEAQCFYGSQLETHWCIMKVDGRKNNSGADKRQKRSYGFKKRIIMEKELLMKSDDADNSSMLVSLTFDLCHTQVDTWYRKRESIRESAAGHMNDNFSFRNKKKGKFPGCETKLYKEFCKDREAGKQVGPFYLRTRMLQIVATEKPPGWRLFSAKQGWLFRFTKRWSLSLRRKTNTKRKPIADRLPFIKRYLAVFRMRLQQDKAKAAYSAVHGIYRHRWSLDQVPFCIMDAKTSYDHKGAQFIHIAANSDSDGKRFGSLQVLCRNKAHDPSLPRGGQPRLCICFRGKGLRISADELDQYHEDVFVLWHPKAWFDSECTNKYVAQYCTDEILKSDLLPGERHLLLCDNLSSQTEKTNPQFKKVLDKKCSCDVWNLLATCTDELQVVDAGLGALIKRFAEQEHQRWCMDEGNWKEWTGGGMSAGRKRILMTQIYGEAWALACASYNFVKNFDQTGSNLTADGSGDDKIKLDKCPEFEFSMRDADRDSKTGLFPAAAPEGPAGGVVEGEEEVVDEEEGIEEVVENGDDSDGVDEYGGCTSNSDLEGDDFECPEGVELHSSYPEGGEAAIVGQYVYQRYDCGWYRGNVQRRGNRNNRGNNLRYAVLFEGEDKTTLLDLFKDDYGPEEHWVLVKQNE